MQSASTPLAARSDSDAASAAAATDFRWLGVALALLGLAFGPALVRMVQVWWVDPEYSHGFLMPPMAGWLLWQDRARVRALRGGTSLLAVPLLAVCLLGPVTAELHFVVSVAPFAFVGGLFAVLLAFFGWRGALVFVPALVPLFLGCPLPGAIQEAATLPLKQISAQFAVGLLQVSSIQAHLDGNVIHLPGADSLWVADACSGIRSLISLLSLAVLACLVWQRHWALKALVILAAVPIAISVNGLRIWLTGWLSVKVSPEAAEGAFHLLEGFVLFAVAGLLLWGFVGLLGLLFPRPEA